MSANCQTIFGISDRSLAPLALAPPAGLRTRLAGLGPVATALLRARRLIEALKGRSVKRRGGGGPPEPPEDQPAAVSIWDDPIPWMLMMH
jgi:hypothetical protein